MLRATCQQWKLDVPPSSVCVFNSLHSHWRGAKNALPSCCVWDSLWQARNVPGPSYPAQESVQQWRPAARAHVRRPLGGLIEGMISRRGAMISLLWHAQNRFAGGSEERKGKERSHSSVWRVDVLDYFKHTNQSERYCTLQPRAGRQAAERRLEIRGLWTRGLSRSTQGISSWLQDPAHLLMPETPLIHEALSRRALCSLACRSSRQQRPDCFSRKLNRLYAGARFTSFTLIFFKVVALESWRRSRCRNYSGFSSLKF